jgi:hypothetical protein
MRKRHRHFLALYEDFQNLVVAFFAWEKTAFFDFVDYSFSFKAGMAVSSGLSGIERKVQSSIGRQQSSNHARDEEGGFNEGEKAWRSVWDSRSCVMRDDWGSSEMNDQIVHKLRSWKELQLSRDEYIQTSSIAGIPVSM